MHEAKRYPERPLYRAINKYGPGNFSVTTLEYCDCCEKRESFYIEQYNVFVDGYNATRGGDGKPYIDDTKIISLYKNHSITEIYKITGHSEDAISTILKRNGKKVRHGSKYRGNPVRCKNIKNPDIRKRFKTCADAARWIIKNGYSETKNHRYISADISKAARGLETRKQAFGFYWYFIEKRNKSNN